MRPKGLTTTETLVAIAFVAVALLAVIGLFTSSFRSLNQTSQMTVATEIARDVIERCKTLGPEAPPEDATYDGTVPTPADPSGFPPTPYPSVERDGVTYTIRVTVAPAPDTVKAKVLTVEVMWKDGARTELQTYL